MRHDPHIYIRETRAGRIFLEASSQVRTLPDECESFCTIVQLLYPQNTKVLKGLGATISRQQDLSARALRKCQSDFSTTVSPIVLACVESLADLHAQGCN